MNWKPSLETVAITMLGIVLLFSLLSQINGYLIEVPKNIVQPKFASRVESIHKEKLILALFENTCDTSLNPTIIRLANEFTFDGSADKYMKPEVITNLQNLVNEKGLIEKGIIFSELNEDHLFELKTVLDVLLHAKTFDTFYNIASWARQNLNCAVFIDCIYAALLNSRHTQNIAFPSPYELFPHYFIKKDAITKGSLLVNGQIIDPLLPVEGNYYTIDTNYTADIEENQDESKLAYFIEDIGLNSFYLLKRLQHLPLVGNNSLDARGEWWYHNIKQLIARYNLERYANGFSEIQEFSLKDTKYENYNPMLMYSNGFDFPERVVQLNIENQPEYTKLLNIENNLAIIARDMVQNGYTKRQIFNHIMDILVFDKNSYEATYLHLLAKVQECADRCPSVLEHYMTMLRDPIYWKICKKIILLLEQSMQSLQTYTRNELYFPGVQVSNIIIKKMATSTDYYEFDVSDALTSNESSKLEANVQVKISQPRLNHKPFSMKLYVSSIVSQKALIKIYLMPQMLPHTLNNGKDNFYLLDSFEYNLIPGSNIIARTSDNIRYVTEDLSSLKSLLKNIEDAEFGLDTLPIKDIKNYANFPERLLLPKGSASGLPYQLFVFVAPYVKVNVGEIYSTEFNSAILSPGYPFDLVTDLNQLFELPNTLFKEVIITHKGEFKKSKNEYSGEKWDGKPYDPSSRPTYDYSSKKQGSSFDYASKKEKYGKKSEFSDKPSYYTTSTITNMEFITEATVKSLDMNTIQNIPIDTNQKVENKPNNSSDTNKIENVDIKSPDVINKPEALRLYVKKTPNVYDYLFRILSSDNESDEDTEERLYE